MSLPFTNADTTFDSIQVSAYPADPVLPVRQYVIHAHKCFNLWTIIVNHPALMIFKNLIRYDSQELIPDYIS